jgi:hypothetical protein
LGQAVTEVTYFVALPFVAAADVIGAGEGWDERGFLRFGRLSCSISDP